MQFGNSSITDCHDQWVPLSPDPRGGSLVGPLGLCTMGEGVFLFFGRHAEPVLLPMVDAVDAVDRLYAGLMLMHVVIHIDGDVDLLEFVVGLGLNAEDRVEGEFDGVDLWTPGVQCDEEDDQGDMLDVATGLYL